MAHFLLTYHLGTDYLERRPEFRAAHLALAWEAAARGELVLAGALEDPVDTACLLSIPGRGARRGRSVREGRSLCDARAGRTLDGAAVEHRRRRAGRQSGAAVSHADADADAGSELAIRARRAEFNRAIAEGDAAAIGPILARDCVMVTGTDSAVIAGRLAQVKVWKREFAAPARMIYLRTPERIETSPVEPIAMEYGAWQGRDEAGSALAAGSYVAKWRKTGGGWAIEAEVFLTLR